MSRTVSTVPPVVLIRPEAKTALEAEAQRIIIGSSDVTGGLLFGYPQDERHRVVVSFVRPLPEVGFGRKDFSLNQSRTSQELEAARKLAPQAYYCGVWYVHRAPTGELTDVEWGVAQGVLEDPDYRSDDLVCLVLCLYGGKVSVYALSFNREHSVRGQLPAPTVLKLTTESPSATAQPRPAAPAPAESPAHWYKTPQMAKRLEVEHKWLERAFRVESAAVPDGRVIFRLMPAGEHADMVFYISCEAGFPKKAPTAFLMVRGDRYPLLSPALNEWSEDKWLFEVAEDLVRWQVNLLDQQVAAAEEEIRRGDYQEASDRLAMVLLIDPRKSGVARLLAQAQSSLEGAGE